MSAFLIRKGVVLAVGADIDVLVNHASKKVKVKEATVLSYTNGYAILHLNYSDGTHGKFDGVSSTELREWAESQKGWPKCRTFSVGERYPMFDRDDPSPAQQAAQEAEAEEAMEAAHYAPVVVRRTRPGVKVIKRTRRAA